MANAGDPLQDIGKEEDADAIKAWLRSQHARSIRERKRGAAPRDFDRIGTEFHRWVREREQRLGLSAGVEFARFIEEDFAFYGHWYARLRHAAEIMTDGLESIHYCAQHNFTLQYPVLLAPLKREDGEQEVLRKLRIVSAFLDILISRRIWNWRAIGYSTMQYAMFLVMRDIRGKDGSSLARLLQERLAGESETFIANDRFHLHGTNRRQIHRLLARMTDTWRHEPDACRVTRSTYTGTEDKDTRSSTSGRPSGAPHRRVRASNGLREYRNRIGGLLLLPKSFNASYGDLPYAEKRKHYLKHNLLAQSLHEDAYERDPGFAGFVRSSGLPFKAQGEFHRDDLDARQELYRRLAEQVWSPERLAQEAES